MRKLILFLSILLGIIVSSCKEDISGKETLIKIDSTYSIKYFVDADNAYIWYNAGCESFEHYVSNWDTTFGCGGGWCMNVMLTSYGCSCVTGIIVNGDTVDGCRCGDWCLMGLYLE